MALNKHKKKLVIVESPAKTRTIGKYLGKDFIVKASVGHVRDLPKSNKNAVDIAHGFKPHYEISKGKEKIIADIKSAAKGASEVLLATDPDREGEAIAWHVAEAAGIKHPKRVVFHEITKEAVEEAIKHPRAIDHKLLKAQEARRVLDRLVGYDLSGLIWKKVRYGLSAGRVQSPALRILVEREREIRAFKPLDYWVLTAEVETQKKERFRVTCVDEPKTAEVAEQILREGRAGSWSVTDVTETETRRQPRAPFTTSTLQQTASSRLGFAPSRTMRIAQKLYEAGHITYMRTDSTTLAVSAQEQIVAIIKKQFGEQYTAPRQYKTRSKAAQEAHEAIRPTRVDAEALGSTPEEKKLYELIWRRAVASQMTPATLMKTRITTNIATLTIPNFTANGSRTLFDGWLAADPAARGEDVELPKAAIGDPLTLIDLASEQKQTQPPSRYSEAGLVKELEKRGIGRPSTYASTIKTIEDRGYVEKLGKALQPTDTGEVVSTFLEQNFGEYVSDTFTADMEDQLDDIAHGKREYAKTLSAFYVPFAKDIKSKEKIEKLTNLGPAPDNLRCPQCESEMVIKLGKNGKFLSCARFPDCDGARTIDGEAMEGPKETGEKCPDCETGKLIERDGRYGRFVACSNYPKCKFVKQDAEAAERAKTGIACPVCKVGEMAERRGRFGVFFGCSNYPKCKYAIKARPTGDTCTLCGSLMMEGTKTIPVRCSSKECPNHHARGKGKKAV